MRKQKNNKQKLILIAGLIMTLILGYRGYQAGWFEDGSVINLGAISASTSSPQPVITVTSWPAFEMKYDAAGNENNLVVKAEYSVTAQNGKIFIPIGPLNLGVMEIKNSLGQKGYPKNIDIKPLSGTSIVPCEGPNTCYLVAQGTTAKFSARQTYNPLTLFSGLYSGKLDGLFFLTNTDGVRKRQAFPGQTSKLNTITVVGEKSPYVHTTSVITKINEPFTLKGVRLNGSYPYRIGSNVPVLLNRTNTEMTLMVTDDTLPGIYTFYLTNSVWGNSNVIQVQVDPAFVPETPVVVSPNGGEVVDFNGEFSIIFKPIPGKQNYVGIVDEAGGGHSYNISYAYTGGSWPIVGQNVSSQTARFDGRKMRALNLLISPSTKFRAMVCTDKGCDQSDNYFTLIDSYR